MTAAPCTTVYYLTASFSFFVLDFENLDFGFVSNFVLRISDF